MLRRLSLLLGLLVLSATTWPATVHAHEHGGGGAHGGYHHGGYHHGGYHYGGFYYPYHGNAFYGPYRPGLYAPYGFYRPYYGFAGPGLGLGGLGGLGLGGLGLGGLGLGGLGLGGYGLYRPYYGGTTVVAPTVVMTPPVAPPIAGAPAAIAGAPAAVAGTPPPLAQTPPPPDNAAHLQLLVPPSAEVLFDGGKTTQTGAIREFVSPPLTAGKVFDYAITVRYFDAAGKGITDRRVIHVRANDWFRLDFTRPAPQEPPVP